MFNLEQTHYYFKKEKILNVISLETLQSKKMTNKL